jgi:hypothetical protein
VTRHHNMHRSPARRGLVRNTAEPSGELSAGDVVVIGEVALAVARPAGWQPVSGPLAEVRIHEHGTHPLPAPAASGETAPGSPAKEYRDDCP